jgi:hypothetical protein
MAWGVSTLCPPSKSKSHNSENAIVLFWFGNRLTIWQLKGADFAEHPCLQDIRERTMTGKITIEQKWHQQSEAAKDEAEKLPHGKEREALMRKARQLHTASQVNEWLSSPGLRPPK